MKSLLEIQERLDELDEEIHQVAAVCLCAYADGEVEIFASKFSLWRALRGESLSLKWVIA